MKWRNLWPDILDSLGLMFLSLILFYNASRSSFLIFAFEVVFNYLMVQLMLRREGWQAKLIATIVIVFNVSVLAYFKYLTFFVEDVIGLVVDVPENWPQLLPIPVKNNIPPGVSFYTFQMISFVVDSLTARRKKPIGFIDYINFVSFFPQIVAGPIERRIDLFPQVSSFRFKFTLENLYEGFRWLSLGFFMKFVLADNLFIFIDVTQDANPWMIWFQAFLFTLRIYFDFAGYSFIAVGLARCLGVRLTLNFLAPYTSENINEFWRRWHITLSTWFRDYVFLQLMGRKKQYASLFLFLTFTLSGFWHGAAWNFIIWGAYHGALLLILRYLGRPFYKFIGKYTDYVKTEFLSWSLTFGAVTLGCMFFMDTDISRLLLKLKTILNPLTYSLSNLASLFNHYTPNQIFALMLLLSLSIGSLMMEYLAIRQEKFEYELLLSIAPILFGLTILLAANTPSEFIYFEF